MTPEAHSQVAARDRGSTEQEWNGGHPKEGGSCLGRCHHGGVGDVPFGAGDHAGTRWGNTSSLNTGHGHRRMRCDFIINLYTG